MGFWLIMAYVFQISGSFLLACGLLKKIKEQKAVYGDEKNKGTLSICIPGVYAEGNSTEYIIELEKQLVSFAYIGIGYILQAITGGGKLECKALCSALIFSLFIIWITNRIIEGYLSKKYPKGENS